MDILYTQSNIKKTRHEGHEVVKICATTSASTIKKFLLNCSKCPYFLQNFLALKLMNFTYFKTDITIIYPEQRRVSRARRIMDVAGKGLSKGKLT